jgi:serine/threonine protein phosphatase 1
MVAVIGDIHGCFHTLHDLYHKIQDNYPDAEVYSVGDLVDRGKFSLETIEYIKRKEIKFTPGNHDYMFTHFFESPGSIFARTWIHNDHGPTLATYEYEPEKIWEHIEFINKQPLFYDTPDCFISHAGFSSFYKKNVPSNFKNDLNSLGDIIYKEYPLEHGVMWNRDKLLNLGKLQIVGHTHSRESVYDKKANALYIDTWAFSGNKLSAGIIENSKIVEVISVETDRRDIY